jgi:hypothetical protein
MYVETKTEIEKSEPSIVENLVESILELAKSHLANMRIVTELRRNMGKLIIDQAYLAISNEENTTNAKKITSVVNGSILFRSLGGDV